MINMILDDTNERMTKTIESFQRDLSSVRTGRANPNMLDRVMVNYYGSPTPVNQIAGISVVEGRQLVIKPYDKSSIKDIRNIRRDSNDEIKKTDGSEDEIKAGQERVQKLTDKFVKEIDEIAKVKEKDIMTV